MNKEENQREIYLQWKSDSWRNVAISLKEAVESGDKKLIKKALRMFVLCRKQFPFSDE